MVAWIQEHLLTQAALPWLGWALVEIRSLVPAWKTSGVIEFLISLTGYKGQTPKLQ